MPEIYRIPVRLDLTDVGKDADALGRILKRVEAQQGQSQGKRASSAERAAEREAKAAERTAERQARAAEKATKAVERQAQKQAEALDKAADRATRAADRAADRAVVAAQRKADREIREEERKAAQVQRIQDQMVRADYRRRVQYEAAIERDAKRKANEAKANAESMRKSIASVGTAGLGAGQAVASVAMGFAGMLSAKSVVDAVAASLVDARDRSREMAAAVIATKDALRTLSGIMGEKPDNKFVLENAVFAAQAGMDVGNARDFREAFRGRSEMMKGKTISGGGFGIFEQMSAGMAAAKNIPSEQAGALFGGILKAENFTNRNLAGPQEEANEAAATASRLFEILDLSQAKMEIGSRQASQLMSFVSENNMESSLNKATDVGVLIGTMAETNSLEAFTMAARGMKGLRDFDNENKKQFFTETGITEKTSSLDAFEKTNQWLQKKVDAGIPADRALSRAGFTEEIENRAIRTVFNARDKVFRPFRALADKPLDRAAPGQLVSEHLASEQGRAAAGRATLEGAQAWRGMQLSPMESRIPAAMAADEMEFGAWGNPEFQLKTAFGMLGDPRRMSAEARIRREAIAANGGKKGGFLNGLANMMPGGTLALTGQELLSYGVGESAQRTADMLAPKDRGVPQDLINALRGLTNSLNKVVPQKAAPNPFNPGKVNPPAP